MTRHDFEELARRDAETGTGLPTRTIVGIGLGIGTCIFVAIIVVAWMMFRKRSAHRKYMAQLEAGSPILQNSPQNMREVSRPRTATSANRFSTWGHLGSNDAVDSQQTHDQHKRKRDTVALPKRIKQKGVTPIRTWGRKHLSVIAEDPANGTPQRDSPLPIFEQMQTSLSKKDQQPVTKEVVLPRSGSPKFDVHPSFAMRSPGQFRSGVFNGNTEVSKNSLNPRSVSMGVLTEDGAVFGADSHYLSDTGKQRRPEMRARSLSLGAPSTTPPSGPVPPLPAMSVASTSASSKCTSAQVGSSRFSSSSTNSTSSSVLVTSPILARRDTDQPLQSPTIEDLVDGNDHAALKSVANRQWQNRRPSPSRCCAANSRVQKPGSVRGRLMRSSTESSITLWRSNSASTSSSLSSGRNRLSVPQICSAEKMSISRVSSSNSLLGSGKPTTPTKRVNTVNSSSVSVFGSPAERKRVSVLREVSGNAPPTKGSSLPRDPSDSTLVSRSSSNGNPFHWDNASVSSVTLPKASALKGSPNARKGHRRQNCVRISTLTPQVLGPSTSRRRSRSISPANLLQGVIEERESAEMQRPRTEPVLTPTEERQSFLLACGGRAPKASALELGDLRVQTLRASLTPSSPTLSNWNTYQPNVPERPLTPTTRQASKDSVYSVASNQERSASRLSNGSFSIPRFPSPAGKSRPTLAPIQCDTVQGPHFVGLSPVDAVSPLDNLSPTDFRPTSSTFGLAISPEDVRPNQNVELPSSPPLPVSKAAAYDPASPQVFDMPSQAGAAQEYDPASPPSTIRHEQVKDAKDTGFFLPFALGSIDLMGDELSGKPKSDGPPCSPKTVSRTRFDTLIDAEQPMIPERNRKRTKTKLTSENASAVMASNTINFPGDNVPVLLPTLRYDDEFCPLPRWEAETSYEDITLDNEQQTEETYDFSRRATLARPPSLSTILQESSSPPLLPQALKGASSNRSSHIRERTASPLGPRDLPAKSLLRNVTELRRMNSDAKGQPCRESRNYVRLGREPSPLLPWIPSTAGETEAGMLQEGSQNSLCDFDFEHSSSSHNFSSTASSNALGEIDFEALEKSIDKAVRGLDEDWRQSINEQQTALQRRRDSNKENHDANQQQQQRNNSNHNANNHHHQRSSSVWDDGEEFWSSHSNSKSMSPQQQQQQQQQQPQPLSIANNNNNNNNSSSKCSPSTRAPTTTTTPSPKTAKYWAEQYQQTLDPNLLSTPVRKHENNGLLSGVLMVAGTPKSLYDADGFLRT
ncbi:hypothetical protein BST61_g5773 [Cercospora zeina]